MLDIPEVRSEIQNSSNAPRVTSRAPIRGVTGWRLNELLKRASATDRALIANDLARGVLQVLRPTHAQVAALAHVSTGYVGTVSRLTGDERVRVARGQLSLSRLHKRRHIVTDTEIDRLGAQYGAEAFLRALDRVTTPRNGG